ncbi:hypothetical protein [Dysgonomonas sp.]
MKEVTLIVVGLFVSLTLAAQVTINADEEPRATLDIRTSDKSNPENNVGLIVPCIKSFSTTNPGSKQHSMIAFQSNAEMEKYEDNSFYFWDNNKNLWDRFLDEYTIEQDLNKVVVSGSALYKLLNGTSTSPTVINDPTSTANLNNPCYVYFTNIEALDPSYKLLSNHRLQIGKSGLYLLIMTAGLNKYNADGIMTYTAEVLVNGTSYIAPNGTTVPLTSSTTIAYRIGRSGIFSMNALVDLKEGDDIIISIKRTFSTGNNIYAQLNSPATIYLQRVKDND